MPTNDLNPLQVSTKAADLGTPTPANLSSQPWPVAATPPHPPPAVTTEQTATVTPGNGGERTKEVGVSAEYRVAGTDPTHAFKIGAAGTVSQTERAPQGVSESPEVLSRGASATVSATQAGPGHGESWKESLSWRTQQDVVNKDAANETVERLNFIVSHLSKTGKDKSTELAFRIGWARDQVPGSEPTKTVVGGVSLEEKNGDTTRTRALQVQHPVGETEVRYIDSTSRGEHAGSWEAYVNVLTDETKLGVEKTWGNPPSFDAAKVEAIPRGLDAAIEKYLGLRNGPREVPKVNPDSLAGQVLTRLQGGERLPTGHQRLTQ